MNEHRAQALVPRHQVFERPAQGFDTQRATQAQGHRNMVGGAVRGQLPEEPLALLGIGQCQRPRAIGQADGGHRCVGRLR
ncbi:hypothetical protein D3C80_1723920 [compost metagenome]